jgi:hypothetical protein
VGLERASQFGDSCRRLTGFGNGGIDEKHNNLRNLTLDKTKESLPQKSARGA